MITMRNEQPVNIPDTALMYNFLIKFPPFPADREIKKFLGINTENL